MGFSAGKTGLGLVTSEGGLWSGGRGRGRISLAVPWGGAVEDLGWGHSL